jgi:hypothetical protein
MGRVHFIGEVHTKTYGFSFCCFGRYAYKEDSV